MRAILDIHDIVCPHCESPSFRDTELDSTEYSPEITRLVERKLSCTECNTEFCVKITLKIEVEK